MSNNIIFYFSGTGNCQKLAGDMAVKLTDCEVVPMSGNLSFKLDKSYERIGFVYPTYFAGMPLYVRKFVSSLDFSKNKEAYKFAVTTCGATAGNALPQLAQLLTAKSVKLDYSTKLNMFSNYIVIYNMSKKVDEITAKSSNNALPIFNDLINKAQSTTKKPNQLMDKYYYWRAEKIPSMDKDFNVSDACNSCGLCVKVCPVKNIQLEQGKPVFNHQCEQCVACIQYCPQHAINYKDKTQNRRRYTNPAVKASKLNKQDLDL